MSLMATIYLLMTCMEVLVIFRIFLGGLFGRLNLPCGFLCSYGKLLNLVIPWGEVFENHHMAGQFCCSFCDHPDESIDHNFRSCVFAKVVWFWVPPSMRMDCIVEHDIVEWLRLQCLSCLKGDEEDKTLLIWFFITLDVIWQIRNEVVWRSMKPNSMDAFQRIRAVVNNYISTLFSNTHLHSKRGV